MKVFKTTSDAYLGVLLDLLNAYEFKASPRGLPVREITNYIFKVDSPDSMPIVTLNDERNKTIKSYTEKEIKLYMSGSNLAEDYATASSFWRKIANPDGTINSAYGYLIWYRQSCGNSDYSNEHYTPWVWARDSLLKDKDSRQAYLRFSLPSHQWVGNKDQVCTMHMNFLIRDEKLHATTVMRSNDVVLGLVYDMPFFIKLQELMLITLREKYSTLEIGTYIHLSHSMHLYERDIGRVKDMLDIRP